DRRPTALGLGPLARQEWFDLVPELVGDQRKCHDVASMLSAAICESSASFMVLKQCLRRIPQMSTLSRCWTIAIFSIVSISSVVTLSGAMDNTIQADSSCNGPTINKNSVCPGEESDPASAINTPTIYSWTVFAQINQPAFPSNNNDTRRVWETWKSA